MNKHEGYCEEVTLGHILHVLRKQTKILENIASILSSGNNTSASALVITLGIPVPQ